MEGDIKFPNYSPEPILPPPPGIQVADRKQVSPLLKMMKFMQKPRTKFSRVSKPKHKHKFY